MLNLVVCKVTARLQNVTKQVPFVFYFQKETQDTKFHGSEKVKVKILCNHQGV
jgi:hypothetical protein